VVTERHDFVELYEGRAWDLFLLVRVPAECRGHTDRLSPRGYRVAEAMHGVCGRELPREGAVVRVDHRKVSVEAVDGVSDECMHLRVGSLAADGLER
jgi:hypothetical protein